MSWIERVPVDEATGLLRRLFDASVKRAGRVWNVTHVMSLNPSVMRDSVRLYGTIMFGESPLGRGQREMLATVVSSEAGCRY